jgi:lipocalin
VHRFPFGKIERATMTEQIKNEPEKVESVKECVKCGAKQINGKWYHISRVPSHKPIYQHDLCLDCRKKVGK